MRLLSAQTVGTWTINHKQCTSQETSEALQCSRDFFASFVQPLTAVSHIKARNDESGIQIRGKLWHVSQSDCTLSGCYGKGLTTNWQLAHSYFPLQDMGLWGDSKQVIYNYLVSHSHCLNKLWFSLFLHFSRSPDLLDDWLTHWHIHKQKDQPLNPTCTCS